MKIRSKIINTIKYRITNIACALLSKHPPLFSAIEIETVNRCNGSCSFCPVNKGAETRPYAKMHDNLFKKIINELAEINYSGYLGIQSNNEPLLDKDIILKLRMAKEKCPSAKLYMYTNGTLLTVEKMGLILDAGVDSVTIDNYSDQLVMHHNLREIDNYYRSKNDRRYLEKVNISVQGENVIRTNRGGEAPNKKGIDYNEYHNYQNIGCLFPVKQMVIRPDGKTSLCCNDALGKVTLGDVSSQSLLEVWSGEKYKNLRKELKENGRINLTVCKNCDVFKVEKSDINLIYNRLLGKDVKVVSSKITVSSRI